MGGVNFFVLIIDGGQIEFDRADNRLIRVTHSSENRRLEVVALIKMAPRANILS